MSLLADIALTHLRGRLRQTLVAVAGVATGVGFSIAMASLMEGSQRDFIETLVNATPPVVVKDEYRNPPRQPAERVFATGAVALDGLKPKEELRGIRNARARLLRIDSLPGLTAAPILRGQVVMRFGGKDIAAALVGIEPERERRVSNIERDLRAGSLAALHAVANGVILGSGLADRLGAHMGDTLTITAPSGLLLRMKVVGLVHTGMVGIDNSEAYALLKKVQVLQNRPNVVNQIRVRLDDAEKARAVARRIEALVGYRTESWDEANEGLLEVLVIRNIIMYTVVGAILLVASFGIFNVISTITHEKARDIAILKSLGFFERDIRRIFVMQSLVLGVIGSLLGWALGAALTTGLASITIDVKAFTERSGLPVFYSFWHYMIAAAFALSAATLAGWLPARRAARVDPVAIIRGAA
jgi:lipoprotein-releasing system permease protein